MNYNLAVIKGDGIGPEVVTEAMKVLDKVGEKFGHTFQYDQLLMGGCSIDAYGEPLTDETVAKAKKPVNGWYTFPSGRKRYYKNVRTS